MYDSALPAVAMPRHHERELWVGLFVIVGLIAGLVTLLIATDPAMFRGRYFMRTVVSDAGGVRKGDPVQMRGVTVGRVRGFDLVPKGVSMRLEIERHFNVPAGSHVELQNNSLLGGSIAQIIPGKGQPLPEDSTLPGELSPGVFNQVEDVTGDAKQTLQRVQALLSDRTINNVQSSSAELNGLLVQLSQLVGQQRESLNGLSQSLNRSALGIEQVTTGPELQDTMRRINLLSQRLDNVAITLNRSAAATQVVMNRLASGQGSLGRLSQDDALYVNSNNAVLSVNRAATEISRLAQDVREHPKKYFNVSLF